jgi:hypothetical protein
MYSRQLRRSLALATGAVVAGEAAARLYYERRLQQQQPQPHHGGSALLHWAQQQLAGPEPLPLPLPLLLTEGDKAGSRSTRSSSTAAFFLGPRPPAGCEAPKKGKGVEEYHAVPLPAADAAHTAEIVARFKAYAGARDLETVRVCAVGGGWVGGWMACGWLFIVVLGGGGVCVCVWWGVGKGGQG